MSRTQEAIHFIVSNTRPEELGRVKLAKVLFFADLESYRRTGRPITDATYEKRQHGPMSRQLYAAIDSLKRDEKIAEKRVGLAGYVQHQFWATIEPELALLSGSDVAILSSYARAICEQHTAASISELTHNAAWTLAGMGEEIPFAAFMVASSEGEPTTTEMAQIEAELGV